MDPIIVLNAQNHLVKLEASMEGLESRLERCSGSLSKTKFLFLTSSACRDIYRQFLPYEVIIGIHLLKDMLINSRHPVFYTSWNYNILVWMSKFLLFIVCLFSFNGLRRISAQNPQHLESSKLTLCLYINEFLSYSFHNMLMFFTASIPLSVS